MPALDRAVDLTAERLAELAALAEAATREPAYLNDAWEYDGGEDGDGIVWAAKQVMGDPVAASHHPQVAAYIAAFDPPTVLTLLDLARQAAEDRARVRRVGMLLAKYAGRSSWVGYEPPRREAWAEIERDLRAALWGGES